MALTHTSGYITYQISFDGIKTTISAQHEKFHRWSVEISTSLSLCDADKTIKIDLAPMTLFDIFESKISNTANTVWNDILFPTDCSHDKPLTIKITTNIQHLTYGVLDINLIPVPITDSERLLMLIESLEKQFNKKIENLTNQLQLISANLSS